MFVRGESAGPRAPGGEDKEDGPPHLSVTSVFGFVWIFEKAMDANHFGSSRSDESPLHHLKASITCIALFNLQLPQYMEEQG